jgi:CheY-like chemotaxis protein
MEAKNILVVDDDNALGVVLCQYLRKFFEGKIKLATDGEKAKDLILDNGFDLVVTDYQMPEMSGLELYKFLHFYTGGKIPVLIMTGNVFDLKKEMAEYIRHGWPVPGDGCILEKPFALHDLTEKIERLLEQA